MKNEWRNGIRILVAFVEGGHLFSFSSDAVSPLLRLVTVYSSLKIISIA